MRGGLRHHGRAIHSFAQYLSGARPADSERFGGRGTFGASGIGCNRGSRVGGFGKPDSAAWIVARVFQPGEKRCRSARRQQLRVELCAEHDFEPGFVFRRGATLASGAAVKSRTVDAAAWTILPFPSASSSARRRAERKELLRVLRVSESPAVVDFSGCPSLKGEDIDLLLECLAQVAGRDTQVVFVAGSSANRVLLEVTRVSSLVPVFNTLEEALAPPQMAAGRDAQNSTAAPIEGGTEDPGLSQSRTVWSA